MSSSSDPTARAAVASLAALTTLRMGGPAAQIVPAHTEAELVRAVAAADAAGQPLLIIAGGSNVVVGDAGWPGVVVHLQTRGIVHEPIAPEVAVEETPDGATRMGAETPARAPAVRLRAQAGEPWDPFVAHCVQEGLSGLECLSGIPGTVGATPIQNVGAYGQDVAERIISVRALDRHSGTVEALSNEQCRFAYRSSRFRGENRWVVLEVVFELTASPWSEPIRYAELARALAIAPGERAPLVAVRDAVLALRRGKGMVLDGADPDSVSAGSFFTNPILEAPAFAELERRIATALGPDVRPPGYPEPDGRVKTSAAWLIERAGFDRGYGSGRAGISTKHTLALVNRGGATTGELVAVAREIAAGVRERFGVNLKPEPIFVGHAWEPDPAAANPARARSRPGDNTSPAP